MEPIFINNRIYNEKEIFDIKEISKSIRFLCGIWNNQLVYLNSHMSFPCYANDEEIICNVQFSVTDFSQTYIFEEKEKDKAVEEKLNGILEVNKTSVFQLLSKYSKNQLTLRYEEKESILYEIINIVNKHDAY